MASALLPGLDLDQLVVLLRGRLLALAARPAEVLRLLVGLRLCRCLGAVGLDHHQPGAFEILLRIDARRLRAGDRGGCRLGFHRPGFFPLNGLLCLNGSRYWRIFVAALAVPVPAMPAPAAALRIAFALGCSLLLWLLGLWRTRRTLLLLRPAIAARRLPIATLVEPALLLAIASAAALAALLLVRSRIAALLGIASRLAGRCWLRKALDGSCGRRHRLGLEPAEEAIDDSCGRFARSSVDGGRGGLGLRRPDRGLRACLGHRRRLIRRDALDDCDLAFALRLGLLAGSLGLLGPLDQLVARRHVFHFVELFVPQPLHLVVRRLEVRVRHQHDVDLQPRLELLDLGALLVEQERGHVHRHLRVHRAGVLLHRLFLQDPQHVQRGRLGAADEAGAAAARAADVRGFFQRGLQPLARIAALDLVLDLEAREQRHVVAVELDLADVAWHHGLHEGAGLLVDLLGIDQDLADVGLEVVADRPDDEARLEVDEEWLLRGIRRGALDRAPQLHQVAQVPVQFLGRAADRCRAGDDAHAIGQLQLVERVAKLVAVFALDAARDAAAARVVRHQDQVAPGQADEGGQRGALRAALVLLDLDDQLLAFAQRILDAGAADVDVRLEIAAGDFLEREEPVPLLAVVDEGGFEAGLDAGDDALVDVALALLP